MRRTAPTAFVTGLAGVTLSVFAVGAAFAVSGGGYGSPKNDCSWYASSWSTPKDKTYPGCHNMQVSIGSGGITWVQWGNDQAPIDPNSKGTPTLLSLGYPGQSGSPHAGCLSVNTDGTTGRAAPAGSKPEAPSKAERQSKYGCGNNSKGDGFALNYDYYTYYCPVAAELAKAGYPYTCEAVPGGDEGSNTFTLDTGGQQNLTKILTQGMTVYFGMDDNIDNGEHDGEGPTTSNLSQGSIAGPSDGGSVVVEFSPQTASAAPSLTRPEGLVNASTGFCADGNCAAATTQRETVYQGCDANTGENPAADRCAGSNGPNSSRDAYNYDGKQWDPYNCSSGGGQGQNPEPDSKNACSTSSSNRSPSGSKNSKGGMDYWRQHEAHNVYAEPGVQFYEDPDAEGSPAGPVYPNPALYVGTCGVVVGGGTAPMPTSPITNQAHQVVISTGC